MGFDLGGLLGGIFGIGSALIGADASRKAANIQADAAKYGSDLQYKMWQEQQALQAPWRQAGEAALNQLLPLAQNYQKFGMAQFQADPGYAFRLNEGLKAVDRQAAARGGLISGAALKASQRYGQEMASQEYTNAFNRYQAERQAQLGPLQSLAGLGQTSANILGQQAGQYGQNAGEMAMQGANARASGYMGQANAAGSALANLGNYYQQNALMSRYFGGGGGWGSSAPAMMPGQGSTLPGDSPEGW